MGETHNYQDQPLIKSEIINVPGDPIEHLAGQEETERWVRDDSVVREYDPAAHLVSYNRLPKGYHELPSEDKGNRYYNGPEEIHELRVDGDRVDVTEMVKNAIKTPVVEEEPEKVDPETIKKELPPLELENPTEAEIRMLDTLTNLDASYKELRELIGATKDKMRSLESVKHYVKQLAKLKTIKVENFRKQLMTLETIEKELPPLGLENFTILFDRYKQLHWLIYETKENIRGWESYPLSHKLAKYKKKLTTYQEQFSQVEQDLHDTLDQTTENFKKHLTTLQEQFSQVEQNLHDTTEIAALNYPRVLQVRDARKQDRDTLLESRINAALRAAKKNATRAAEMKAEDLRAEKLGNLIDASGAGISVTKDEKSGFKMIEGKEWAGLTELAGVHQHGDEQKNMLIKEPTFETEHLFEGERLYEVKEGDRWQLLPPYARGHVEAGEILRLEPWQVTLGEDGKTFILKDMHGVETVLNALTVRKVVKDNSLLRKVIINSDHPQEITIGRLSNDDSPYFDYNELKRLIEGEILDRKSVWDKQVIEKIEDLPQSWRDSGLKLDRREKLFELKNNYPGSRVVLYEMIGKTAAETASGEVSQSSGEEKKLIRKYKYMALEIPVGIDDNGQEILDVLAESAQYGDAAYFVPHENGDWRTILVGRSKAYAIAHDALPLDHRSDPGNPWQAWWNDVIQGLVNRDPKAIALLQRRIGWRKPDQRYYEKVED